MVLGVVFLAIATGLWIAARQSKPPAPPPPPKPAGVARVNPMAQPDLELEQPQPEDAGTQPEAEPAKPRRVVRRAAGEWECSGDLAGAAKVVHENSAQVRSCYERRLKMNNALQGELHLKLKVGANGKVVASAVSGSLHDEEVNACVRKLAQSWTFPLPTGGNCAVVQVPFQFSPKQ